MRAVTGLILDDPIVNLLIVLSQISLSNQCSFIHTKFLSSLIGSDRITQIPIPDIKVIAFS